MPLLDLYFKVLANLKEDLPFADEFCFRKSVHLLLDGVCVYARLNPVATLLPVIVDEKFVLQLSVLPLHPYNNDLRRPIYKTNIGEIHRCTILLLAVLQPGLIRFTAIDHLEDLDDEVPAFDDAISGVARTSRVLREQLGDRSHEDAKNYNSVGHFNLVLVEIQFGLFWR